MRFTVLLTALCLSPVVAPAATPEEADQHCRSELARTEVDSIQAPVTLSGNPFVVRDEGVAPWGPKHDVLEINFDEADTFRLDQTSDVAPAALADYIGTVELYRDKQVDPFGVKTSDGWVGIVHPMLNDEGHPGCFIAWMQQPTRTAGN